MSVIAGQRAAGAERPTLASTWSAISGGGFTDELLAWPPDVFALTNVLLDRSEAFRFALSPPEGVRWPPAGARDWCDAVVDAGREWSEWVEERRGYSCSGLNRPVRRRVWGERAGSGGEEEAAGILQAALYRSGRRIWRSRRA